MNALSKFFSSMCQIHLASGQSLAIPAQVRRGEIGFVCSVDSFVDDFLNSAAFGAVACLG